VAGSSALIASASFVSPRAWIGPYRRGGLREGPTELFAERREADDLRARQHAREPMLPDSIHPGMLTSRTTSEGARSLLSLCATPSPASQQA